jgi:hypothetical protein
MTLVTSQPERVGRGDLEFGAKVAGISEDCGTAVDQFSNDQQVGNGILTNCLVISTVHPGNRHRSVPLGDGHLASEDYCRPTFSIAD